MSKVKVTPLQHSLVGAACLVVNRSMLAREGVPTIPGIDHWFRPEIQQALASLLEGIAEEGDADVRDALRTQGVTARLAVDDFGDGAMTPRRLMECRPDFVKLDKGIVRNVDVDTWGQQLIHGLKNFARAAGGALIAEGIESAAERDTLARLGVPFGQAARDAAGLGAGAGLVVGVAVGVFAVVAGGGMAGVVLGVVIGIGVGRITK